MEQSRNAPLERLLNAISDEEIRTSAASLVAQSVMAVEELSTLDDKIYLLGGTGEGSLLQTGEQAEMLLRQLASDVLGGVRRLEQHLKGQSKADAAADDDLDFDLDEEMGLADEDEDEDEEIDFDFDLGGEAPALPDAVSLDESDIDGAFDFLASPETRTCAERWQALSGEIESVCYALGSQLRSFDERFEHALVGARYGQALRELNDVDSSLTDGVFALLSAVYKAYLGEVDRNDLLPGHRDTLAKALLIRRGLADFRRAISRENQVLQDDAADEARKNEAFSNLCAQLTGFLHGDVFGVMRPADRSEFKNFEEHIIGGSPSSARFDCEGLDKYLDSLAVVNQRDVLIKHDSDQTNDILGLLEAAGPLLDISPHGAADMVAQAFQKADAMYGLRDPLDELLREWKALPAEVRSQPQRSVEIGKRLQALLQARQ